ncbi:hypothetical protein SI65_03959 [Aspergillus cristatus]|uniref:Uncharacterized protein n=1 Tax=Aspergillus cristatus TaxID=573508 RepID=A0A1E3BKM2_ASPCR|nr:hypothetical protein SI65_03959 [Aspergillus cristatus]
MSPMTHSAKIATICSRFPSPLRSTNTATTNPMSDVNMGEAPGAHETPTASPREPTTPKRPPKRPRPETPRKAIQAPPTPKNWHPDQDTPPASPSYEAPQSQLGLELQRHIAAAVASRTAQLKTTGDEVLELVSVISQKVAKWEEKSLQGAASLGKDIRTLVLNFSRNLATAHPAKQENHQPPHPKHNSYAEATRTPPNAPKTQLKIPKTTHKSPQSENF